MSTRFGRGVLAATLLTAALAAAPMPAHAQGKA